MVHRNVWRLIFREVFGGGEITFGGLWELTRDVWDPGSHHLFLI